MATNPNRGPQYWLMPRRVSNIRRRMSTDLDLVAEKAETWADVDEARRVADAELRRAIFRAWDGGWTIDEIAEKLEATRRPLKRAMIHRIVRSERDD